MEVSFLELKAKQVINTVDGKCLGHITDIIFDVVTAKTLGFIVPNCSGGFFSFFKADKNLFIPFDCVCKIGVDVVLVELYIGENNFSDCKDKNKKTSCVKTQNIVLNDKNK